MKILIVVLGMLWPMAAAVGQSSVTLSSLKVTDVIDPSKHEINRFFIELQASEPASLGRLEVNLQDTRNPVNNTRTILPVIIKDGKPEVDFGKFSVPFEGKGIRFFISVVDQFKNNYSTLEVTGYDKEGNATTPVVFNRRK